MGRAILSGDECDGQCLYVEEKDDGTIAIEMIWDMGMGEWTSSQGDLGDLPSLRDELSTLEASPGGGDITVRNYRKSYGGDDVEISESGSESGSVSLDRAGLCALLKYVEDKIAANG